METSITKKRVKGVHVRETKQALLLAPGNGRLPVNGDVCWRCIFHPFHASYWSNSISSTDAGKPKIVAGRRSLH